MNLYCVDSIPIKCNKRFNTVNGMHSFDGIGPGDELGLVAKV